MYNRRSSQSIFRGNGLLDPFIMDVLQKNLEKHLIAYTRFTQNLIIKKGSIIAVKSNMKSDLLNKVLPSSSQENVDFRDLQSFYEDQDFTWITFDCSPQFEKLLVQNGFVEDEIEVPMILNHKISFINNTEMRIERVTRERILDFNSVLESIGGCTEMREFLQSLVPEFYELDDYQLYVGYVGSIAVCTGILCISEFDVGGIYYIATRPEYRRKGLATCILRFLLSNSSCKKFVLMASEAGIPVYEKIGFERLAGNIKQYLKKPHS